MLAKGLGGATGYDDVQFFMDKTGDKTVVSQRM